jgi:peptidoglycan/LPS O-acetylase OafA/YrhL
MERVPVKPLPALTSLRFAAAAAVVVGHSAVFGLNEKHWKPFDFRQAVSFFFVLSGFILTHAYPHLETWGQRGRFLLARAARLWPGHIASFLLIGLFCLDPRAPRATVPDWLTAGLNLLLLHAWVPIRQVYCSWNHVSWSISTEFAFYLTFAALLPFWRRLGPAALAVALALPAVLITVCLWGNLKHWDDPSALRANADGLLYAHPLARVWEFLLGVATARLWQRVEPRLRVGRLGGAVMEAAAAALAFAALYFNHAAAEAVERLPWPGKYGRIWLEPAGLACPAFAVLIAVLACGRGWPSRLLAWRPLVLLGEISFAVYMLHRIPAVWFYLHVSAFDELPGWVVYLVYWLVVLLGSHLLWAGLERPLRGWIVALWPAPGGKPKAPAPAPPRSLWGRLSAPGWRWLGAEALLLAALLAPVAALGARPPVRYVGPDAALALARRGSAAARDARFGGRLALRGAEVSRTPQGLAVRLAWQSLQDQPADLTVRLVFLGRDGGVRCQWDRRPEEGPASAACGALWRQKESVPGWAVEAAESMGVAVLSPTTGPLPIDRGPRDPTGFLLLLPVPRQDREGCD